MGRTRRTYHARLFAAWDHWVVEVPEARGVHAIVLSLGDAEEVARSAVATVMDLDPRSIRVVVDPA